MTAYDAGYRWRNKSVPESSLPPEAYEDPIGFFLSWFNNRQQLYSDNRCLLEEAQRLLQFLGIQSTITDRNKVKKKNVVVDNFTAEILLGNYFLTGEATTGKKLRFTDGTSAKDANGVHNNQLPQQTTSFQTGALGNCKPPSFGSL